MTPPREVYAVCEMDEISPGEARAFDLAVRGDDGMPRPFRIFIVRDTPTTYRAYENVCPHEKSWLNIGSGSFFDGRGNFLRCGRHGALFDIATGACVDGPCEGAALKPITAMAMDGDVCIAGVTLMEDDGEGDFYDETMEIMIHPD